MNGQTFQNHVRTVLSLIDGLGCVAGSSAAFCLHPDVAPIPNDIDVFCYGQSLAEAYRNREQLLSRFLLYGYEVSFRNATVINLAKDNRPKVQIVQPRDTPRTFGSPSTIINGFDFTVCRAAVSLNGSTVADVNLREHLEARKLVIHTVVCAISTVKRMNKYGQKGFSLSATEVFKVLDHYAQNTNPRLQELMERDRRGDVLTPEERDELHFLIYVD